MIRCPIVLAAVLGLASALTGCATREFVRLEVGRSQATLGPAVDRLATDLEEHRAEAQDLTVMVTEIDRDAEDATRASIEALGVADVAVGKAAEAMSYATLALARADEAHALAQQSLAETGRTDERLIRLWARRGRPSVVGALVLRFGADQWTLDAEAEKVTRDVVERLSENPALVVQVEGYADGLGAPPHNLRLSQLRAEAVVRFLIAQGVELHRLRAIGLGAIRPVGDNSTLEGRRQNRRVVVRVLDPS